MVPDWPPPGFDTTMSLTEPGVRCGVVAVSVCSSVTLTLVAARPPTVTVAPSSKASPVTVMFVAPAPPYGGVLTTANRGENSDVFPAGSVAVAVTGDPASSPIGSTTLNVASPDPSVATGCVPRYVLPSGRSWGRRAQTGLP